MVKQLGKICQVLVYTTISFMAVDIARTTALGQQVEKKARNLITKIKEKVTEI